METLNCWGSLTVFSQFEPGNSFESRNVELLGPVHDGPRVQLGNGDGIALADESDEDGALIHYDCATAAKAADDRNTVPNDGLHVQQLLRLPASRVADHRAFVSCFHPWNNLSPK